MCVHTNANLHFVWFTDDIEIYLIIKIYTFISVFCSLDLLQLEVTVGKLELQLSRLESNVLPRLERLENILSQTQQHYSPSVAVNLCTQEGNSIQNRSMNMSYTQPAMEETTCYPEQSTPLRTSKQTNSGNATSNSSLYLHHGCRYDTSPSANFQAYHGTDTIQGQIAPQCTRIKRKEGTNYFSSSDVAKSKLSNPDTVLAKYRNLRIESKVGMLAIKLAKEAIFGEDVLAQCTVSGCRNLPALPVEELNQLKQALFQQFPSYWTTPAEFEALWERAVEAIGQCAKGLRKKKPLAPINLPL